MKACDRLSEHTRRLPPLKIGDHVRIQNQIGPNPLKWDRTGIVVEVRQFHQYAVKIDGSNRSTLRNRKFLRKFLPMRTTTPPRSVLLDLGHPHNTEQDPDTLKESEQQLERSVAPKSSAHPVVPVSLELPVIPETPIVPNPEQQDYPPEPGLVFNQSQPHIEEWPPLRRSARVSYPPGHLRDFVTK